MNDDKKAHLSKKDIHLQELREYSALGKELQMYLLDHSNLPGKRGNLELAAAFRDYIEEIYAGNESPCLQYCLCLIAENPPEKSLIGNEEFLPFCAIVALGRIGRIDASKRNAVIELIKENAQDERWRIREAVAMAIQDLLAVDPAQLIHQLVKWTNENNPLLHRAIVAGLAEPPLMKNPTIARAALQMHKTIINKIEMEKNVRDIHFQVLVKGLCYTLSVIITGIEEEGFSYLEELVNKQHPVIRKIARENLKKNRLKLLNERKVAALQVKLVQAA
ncbi:hypothetical protein JW998_06215 [candidate division KSB1 bacterium]|nr:hypothetical protein [candidate division KSB1 bacterium]